MTALPQMDLLWHRVVFTRPELDDRGLSRMLFRLALFKRRGRTEAEADTLADRLAQRDHDRDDRRICLECNNLRPQQRCAHKHAVLLDVLQRCDNFKFEMPA